MGTNYYLRGKSRCSHCDRGPERGLHIGKSSGGWAFSLRIYPQPYESWPLVNHGIARLESLDDWMPLFYERGVIDEYGDDVPAPEMIRVIIDRHHPDGLQRHTPYPQICVGIGGPTWDHMVGEFS